MLPKKINLKSKDGVKISVSIYNYNNDNNDNDESKSIKGTVIVVHGFGEHGGSYMELAEYLKQADYASVVFDQRGHGAFSEYSSEKRMKYCGIIPGYNSFLDDIDTITAEIKQRYPGKPVILYGHSMGGNIAVNYLLKHNQADFSCAVLESPWLGLYKEVNPLVSLAAKVLGRLSPGIAIVNKLSHSDITADKIKAEEMKNDPLYHNRISLRMFSGIKNACAYAIKNAGDLTVPVYLAYAKNERIVSNTAIKQFQSSCGANVKTVEYDAYHAIHNDLNKHIFYKDIIKFIDEHSII